MLDAPGAATGIDVISAVATSTTATSLPSRPVLAAKTRYGSGTVWIVRVEYRYGAVTRMLHDQCAGCGVDGDVANRVAGVSRHAHVDTSPDMSTYID